MTERNRTTRSRKHSPSTMSPYSKHCDNRHQCQ